MTKTYDGPVFLGGTCGDNHWREEIVIPSLLARGIEPRALFNPVVDHWDEAAQDNEDRAKREARYMLYVIASPDPQTITAHVSAYSLVELVMGLYDDPERTVAIFSVEGMAPHTAKAINKTIKDLRARFPQAPIFHGYAQGIEWLVRQLV